MPSKMYKRRLRGLKKKSNEENREIVSSGAFFRRVVREESRPGVGQGWQAMCSVNDYVVHQSGKKCENR